MPDAPDLESLIALAQRLQASCVAKHLSVASAESCTGGLVAHVITENAGSSEHFRGAIVSYSNEAKANLLHVPAEVLAAHGAVSAQTARAMATGARQALGVDVAVSVTGIAGPGGGSEAKPVGLTYIAVADDAGADVRRFVWAFDRAGNKRASAEAALGMLLERVEAAPARGEERSAS